MFSVGYEKKWSTAAHTHTHGHGHTHTHTFNGRFPGIPGWVGTRKVKPIWILLKQKIVSGSGISWAKCKSAPRSRQITKPAPHHSVFYRPDALSVAQPTSSKHWKHWQGHLACKTAQCNPKHLPLADPVQPKVTLKSDVNKKWVCVCITTAGFDNSSSDYRSPSPDFSFTRSGVEKPFLWK